MGIACVLLSLFFCFSPSATGDEMISIPSASGAPAANVFYADKAKVGDVYSGMTLTDLDYNLESNDVIAQFVGEAVISGTYELLPDDNEFFSGLAFDVDPSSLSHLPALATDERDGKWFIFISDDYPDLLKQFDNPKSGVKGKATIIIKDYRINHRHTEISDTAKLVQIIKLGNNN